ncbi:Uncharacterised protein [Klebsiella pneumoniae]|uniref:Uncharacterized protein n=1 Tax=Klebsiella pneumoniae TaxID=573 RepID=A0A377ZTV3_KLEPN|nr:Uncharacterised protein [Klebsiella pneumoniae]STU30649.1 Uncharacterised protein [Klebsiella pneumoniae]STU51255.1 Uncharacterised protein [Klebsiella pneumoniae]STU84591.1 Uncharacterised protein [Klebsiella pneumoniae]
MTICEKRLKRIAGGEPFFPGEVVAMACALLERAAKGQIAGELDNCRSSENVQVAQEQSGIAHVPDTLQNGVEVAAMPVNDVTTGKPLTITLPDISSKAFWSGSGKDEVFHPETYRRWVKEAIERYCTIARIDVEVK